MKRLHFTYQYKDHLGNNRLSYADSNGNGKIDTPGSTAVTIWEDGFEDKSTANGDWESVGAKYGRKITGFDNSKAKSGTTSGYIKLNANGKWTDYYVHSNEWIDINITEPTLYRFSGWVYLDNLIYRGQFFFFMNKESETNYFTEVIHVETREKNKWVYMEKVVLVQPEIKKLNFRIDADSRQNGTVWYDNLKIEKLDMSQNEIVSETNYYPFGLAHKGYNEHKNSSNLGENYKFNGKENEEELGLNTYDFGARIYMPDIVRTSTIDPLADDPSQTDKSPYAMFWNNPISNIDPTGMMSWDWREDEWIPKVNSDGSTSYIAEAGDSAATLSSQYGIDISQAEAITGTSGTNEIAAGTEVSGQDVVNATGSEVLKLNDFSDPQTNLNHVMFSAAHAKSKGAHTFLMSDYFNNIFNRPSIPIKALGNLNIDGQKIKVGFELNTYSHFGGYSRNSYQVSYAYGVKSMTHGRDSYGTILGEYKGITNYRLPSYLYFTGKHGNEAGLKGQGYINITTSRNQFYTFKRHFERSVPNYNYIRTQNFRN